MHFIAIAFGLCLLAGLVLALGGEGGVEAGLVRLFKYAFYGVLLLIYVIFTEIMNGGHH